MDRMLVVVFDSESKAYEGQKALLQLDAEGSIAVYAFAVLAKNENGTATVKQGSEAAPTGALIGTSFGSLLGLLGGPVGLAFGSATGALSGMWADLDNARVGYDFIDDVSKQLSSRRVALVAEIEEEWTTPVDSSMEANGGTVFRRSLSDIRDAADSKEVAAMKADFAQMKTEHEKADARRKARLEEKMHQLDSKIQDQLQRAQDRREAFEREAKAKAEALKTKAVSSRAKAS